ncbi:MAG: hypothetical protein R2705_21795 [Ilumatobacteraceae bacterium]
MRRPRICSISTGSSDLDGIESATRRHRRRYVHWTDEVTGDPIPDGSSLPIPSLISVEA